MKTLHELFVSGLAEVYDAEMRIASALPGIAREASCPQLKDALLFHLKETKWHVTRIEQVFDYVNHTASRKMCKSVIAMLEEWGDMAAEFAGTPALNAALIAAAQKVEHHEMACFGCLHEWAEAQEQFDAAEVLRDILADVRATDDRFTDLALAGTNDEALARVEMCR